MFPFYTSGDWYSIDLIIAHSYMNHKKGNYDLSTTFKICLPSLTLVLYLESTSKDPAWKNETSLSDFQVFRKILHIHFTLAT